MRIFDDENDRKLDSIMLMLTKDEALQLLSYIQQLLTNSTCDHFHLSNEDYQKEIIISLYNPNNLHNLHPRMQKLIELDQ